MTRSRLTADEVVELRRRRRREATPIQALADERGVPFLNIYRALRGETWASVNETEPPLAPREVRATPRKFNAALTDDEVRDVRRLRQEGMSRDRVAAKFGVSPRTIWQIDKGVTYRDVN